MPKQVCILIVFFYPYVLTAQSLNQTLSITPFSTVHQSIERNTAFDVFTNPATIVNTKMFMIGVCSEQRFGQKDIISADVAAVLPTKNDAWALPIHIDKAGTFTNNTPALVYARKISSNIALGVQFGYNMQSVEKYGSQQQIDTKLGLIIKLTNQLQTGATIHNPQFWFKKETQIISRPVSVAWQVAYEPNESFLLQTIIQKQQNQAVQVIAGAYYRCHKYVEVAAGINSEGNQFWGSSSFILKNFRLGITTHIHPQLGITPGLMIMYNSIK